MASAPSSTGVQTSHTTYSDKQVVSSIDHGPEVVNQPYPDAYAYANPNNTNNDSSKGGAAGGGLEAVENAPLNGWTQPAWSEQQKKRRICGLSRKNFIVVVCVVTALVVAAIIGGSVGGVLASNKNSSGSAQADSASVSTTSSAATTTASAAIATSSEVNTSTDVQSISSSPTSTSTTSASATTTSTSSTATSTSGEGSYDCPADNDRTYSSSLSSSQTFTILCDTDWPSGVDGLNGGSVTDLTAIVAYSIDACIDQCVAYNVAGGSCGAVVYGANITLALSRGGIQGNCFLKDQAGAANVADNSGQVEAAYLSSTNG